MAWAGSNRRSRLPADWPQRRKATLKRDREQCQWVRDDTGRKCLDRATDVDHIIAGDNHDPSNLQSLCGYHHRLKSTAEGHEAARANITRRKQAARRKHPGII